MIYKLILLFVAMPLIEISILIKLGETLGFWPTLWLIIGTGILGATLARRQGLDVYNKIQLDLSEGRIPASHMLDGLLILIAGLVLLTPGLITDLIGFALLFPFIRNKVKEYLRSHLHRITGADEAGEFYDELDSTSSGIH
ncbi:MAG: membrane protein FxsA [Deferribacteres bacterium]|nr:membrane protein FxsA [candidate division KSB1 bacterium]MCB9503029.1 membrane protein FxsA [Deferribacteres bacterium]